MRPITRDDFITQYAADVDIPAGILVSEYGMVALPCDCGAPNCPGWAMRSALLLHSLDMAGVPDEYRVEVEMAAQVMLDKRLR